MSVPVVGLRALGADVDLRVVGPEPEALAGTLRERWHLCLRPETAPRPEGDAGVAVLEVARVTPPAKTTDPGGGPDLVADEDQRRLLQRLTQTVTRAAITARTGELLMLHAAGLSDLRTGATAVFVAPGNTGKTTLCRTLGPGRGYLSDETVGIRRDGSLEVYPKPLSIRRPDWAGVKDETAPGDLGLLPPAAPPWLAGIVLLTREPDRPGPPLAEPLEVFEAIVALAPESSGFMRTRGPLQWLAEALDRTGGAQRVTYAEAAALEPVAADIWARSTPW